MFFRGLRVCILLACGCGFLWAQAQTGDEVLAKARRVYGEQGPRAALPEFEHALGLYRQAGDRRGEAITLGYIGNCYKRFGEFPKALEHLRKALSMKQELGDRLEEGKTLSHLGLVFWEMGEYAPAIEHLTRSIAIAREVRDQTLEATALNNLSLVYDEQGDYRRSLEQYRRALELHRATGYQPGESDTLGNIGGVYLLLGQYREAMRYYQQALAISERLSLKSSASQDLGNLALCHLGLGQVTEALGAFDRALVLAREAGLKKEEADWRKGKGSALARTGKYDQALEEYRQALQAYEQAGLKRELVEALNDRGNLHLLLGDAASAEKDFRRAVELSRGIGHPRGVTANLLALGDLEWRRRRLEEAEALYRSVFERAREADDRAYMASGLLQLALTHRDQGRADDALAEARQALEIARKAEALLLVAQAQYVLGEVARAQNRTEVALEHYRAGEGIARTANEPELSWRLAYGRGQALETAARPQDAVDAYQQAVAVIETVRSQLREERFQAGYIEDKYQVYIALVRLLLKLKQPEQAFLFAEKLRARSYLELLNRSLSSVGSPAEQELRARIRRLQQAIEAESAKPKAQQRSQAVAIYSTELAAAERAYQELLDDLRARDPESVVGRTLSVPSTEQVQERLPSDTALIEYVITEEAVAIFVLTARRLEATTVPERAADLRARVELLRDLIQRERSQDWRKPAESLRRVLIEPIERAGWLEGIRRLYVVPHGILHYLPFAALPRTDGKGPHFLMEEYELAYLPAAAALAQNRREDRLARSLFALAPARAHLLYTQQEARGISEFFSQSPLVLVGTEATESSFKRSAGRYRVLHLATHGFFNKLNPLFSGVQLEPDRQEDGRLEVHEILGLRLKADLVTLSACETALASGYFTDVPAGDDFVGLTRAFLFAGTPSVLASLWEVNDRSTLRLMRGFYGHLAASGKAGALAQAQRGMRQAGGRYNHPYFWAPFVLVGEMK